MINDFSKKKIIKILKELDIKKNDDLMIHGDAAIIYQYNINKKKGFDLFFQTIEEYVKKKGTILVPSFTYSFCQTKKFNKTLTKSQVGNFSKTFGKRIGVKRTNHPIFSFYIKVKKTGIITIKQNLMYVLEDILHLIYFIKKMAK